MNKTELRLKMVAAFDDIVKGAIALVVTAVVTSVVNDGYDKFVVARRYNHLNEDPNAQA